MFVAVQSPVSRDAFKLCHNQSSRVY